MANNNEDEKNCYDVDYVAERSRRCEKSRMSRKDDNESCYDLNHAAERMRRRKEFSRRRMFRTDEDGGSCYDLNHVAKVRRC